jgi:ribosomal protein L22
MSEEPQETPETQEAPETPVAEQPEAKPAAEPKPRTREPAAAKADKTADMEGRSPSPAPAKSVAEKAARRQVVRAHAKYVRTSARKARIVCDHIRGKSVAEARAILQFAPRAVARDWAKLLNSAVANAENNHELVADDLRIKEVYADEGPTLKRFRPRAMGRATQIRKRTSHLTITLTPKE